MRYYAVLIFMLGCTGETTIGESPDTLDIGESDSSVDTSVDASPDMLLPPDYNDQPDCDPLDPARCVLPWPSNAFLVDDSNTSTGVRLAFGPTTLPKNHLDVHISAKTFEHMDGYGVGTPIITYLPGVELSQFPQEDSIGSSGDPDARAMLFQVTDEMLVRVPLFAELDLRAKDDTDRVLYLRPAVLLEEGARYIVAFRDVVDTTGARIPSSPAFAALRDQKSEGRLSARQTRFENIFARLATEGVARDSLTLAWDFQTRSCENQHGSMIHMRDDALALTQDGLTVTLSSVDVLENDPHIALDIEGTVRVPHYLVNTQPPPLAGWEISRGEDGMPQQVDWREAPFRLRVPHSALDGTPHGLLQYGHGLNGTYDQVGSRHLARFAASERLMIFGVNLIGMATEDAFTILILLQDFSKFRWLTDRVHQGLLDSLLTMRGLRDSLVLAPELEPYNLVIDPDRTWYTGDSQGGIYGATYMALSTDVTRGQLGVPGQNYSILLRRSVDFTPFLAGVKRDYADPMDRAIGLAAIQSHWDEVDPVGYYHHISRDLFENTPSHAVLASTAKGDHQVPLVTMEIVARSDVGVALMANYDDERAVEGVPEVAYPHTGSGLVNWHFGNPWPAIGNVPPADEVGDPHGKPRKLLHYQQQMIHFFETGEIIDVCGGAPCAEAPPAE